MIKKKEDSVQMQKPSTNKLKQMAATALLCAGGASAFAGGGSLYGENANVYKTQAVDDIVSYIEYVAEARADNHISEEEQNTIKKMHDDYDFNYGEGAFKFVLHDMQAYAHLPGGKKLMKEAEELGLNPMKPIANRAVKRAAQQQETMKLLDSKLSDYEYSR